MYGVPSGVTCIKKVGWPVLRIPMCLNIYLYTHRYTTWRDLYIWTDSIKETHIHKMWIHVVSQVMWYVLRIPTCINIYLYTHWHTTGRNLYIWNDSIKETHIHKKRICMVSQVVWHVLRIPTCINIYLIINPQTHNLARPICMNQL